MNQAAVAIVHEERLTLITVPEILVCRSVNGVTQSDSDFPSSQGAKSAELRSNLSDERRSDGGKARSNCRDIYRSAH